MKKTGMSKFFLSLLCVMLIAVMAFTCTGFCEAVTATEAVETVEVEETYEGDVEWIEVGEGSKEFAFIVYVDEENVYYYAVHTDAETVGEALVALELIAGEDSAYGLYVKTVCGVTADYDKDGVYWAFYIDGEYAMTGVDSTEIAEDSVYAFAIE